jgi:hypothetical protein
MVVPTTYYLPYTTYLLPCPREPWTGRCRSNSPAPASNHEFFCPPSVMETSSLAIVGPTLDDQAIALTDMRGPMDGEKDGCLFSGGRTRGRAHTPTCLRQLSHTSTHSTTHTSLPITGTRLWVPRPLIFSHMVSHTQLAPLVHGGTGPRSHVPSPQL